MLLIAVNAVFAFIFLSFARTALSRALPLLRTGWLLLQTGAQRPPQHIERRRDISAGGRFVIGGVFWLLAGLVAGGAGLYFGLQVVMLWL